MSDDSMALGYALGSDNNNSGSGMWGGDGSWIFAFLIIALIFGGGNWGGFGFGGNGANGAGYQGTVTRSDLCNEFSFNNLQRSVLGIQDSLSNGFCNMNNGMLTGFNTIGNTVSEGFHGVDNAVCQLGYQTAQLANNTVQSMNSGFNGVTAGMTALGSQISSGFCDTNYNAATNARDIIQSTHSDTDRIIARLDQMETARQAEKIAALQTENQTLKFAASQEAQNNYLVNALRPAPVPAFPVPAPYQYSGCTNCGL